MFGGASFSAWFPGVESISTDASHPYQISSTTFVNSRDKAKKEEKTIVPLIRKENFKNYKIKFCSLVWKFLAPPLITIDYPYETVMEEEPEKTSRDFGVMNGSIVDSLEDDFLSIGTCFWVIIAVKNSFRQTNHHH